MALEAKNLPADEGDMRDMGWIPGSGRSPGRGHGNPLSCLENPHGQRSLAGYGPWGRKESDTTDRLSTQHVNFTGLLLPRGQGHMVTHVFRSPPPLPTAMPGSVLGTVNQTVHKGFRRVRHFKLSLDEVSYE